MNFSKAFDSVNHSKLSANRKQLPSILTSLIGIIASYLQETITSVCNWKVVNKRTTQGSVTELYLLLVFRVTPFKIDQNNNQNRLIDKVQNLGNESRYIHKDPRQDSGQRNISYTRYPRKCFTQIYRDLYGDAMLVLT